MERFHKQLLSYGYDVAEKERYDSQVGFMHPHLPPVLFADGDLDRVRINSFVDGKLPSMVTNVSFELNVTAEPLSRDATAAVYRSLLESDPVTRGHRGHR